ncbi:universal stress protein UspA [Dictyobacter vulcani]|uniref:Universal stress protein UspA n=1 Tax=Dictyobacter vulcani TaxID=2607529 RepID=A0A5J4KW24_9CHLR|nr:universal stress protein [Dictyobacter vulcani]GER90681.1 universal stress protein UspA [Dictyobacter vulcani]
MSSQFQHIIVPLDGSACAEHALPMAARIARNSGARITLLYILETIHEYATYAVPSGLLSGDMLGVSEQQARDYLMRIQKDPVLNGIALHPSIFIGQAAATIVENARLEHADLIVMCSHGRTGFRRIVMGSVTQQVMRESPVPVLVLQQSDQECLQEQTSPFRILVALDGSERAEAALKPAAMLSVLLSEPQPGSLYLLRVVSPVLPTESDEVEDTIQSNRHALQCAKKYLRDVAEKMRLTTLPDLPLQISYSVRYDSDISGTVRDAAMLGHVLTTPPISALAITTHGRHGVPRLLLGSVTENILGHSMLPLLVVRVPDKKIEHQSKKTEPHTHVTTSEKDHEAEPYSPFTFF